MIRGSSAKCVNLTFHVWTMDINIYIKAAKICEMKNIIYYTWQIKETYSPLIWKQTRKTSKLNNYKLYV